MIEYQEVTRIDCSSAPVEHSASKAEDATIGAKGERGAVDRSGTLARQYPEERIVKRRRSAERTRARQKGSGRQRARANDRLAVGSGLL